MKNRTDPEISIIIPNLNSSIVDRTVQSIFDQATNLSFEVIVVGLNENRLLDKFLGKISHINTGSPVPPGKARNIGVRNSKGNLLVFIDSDAIAQPQFLDRHFVAHNENKNAIIGGSVSFPNKPFFQLCDNISTFHEYMPHLYAGKKRMIPTVNLSILREKFLTLNGFNSNLAGEDTEFSRKAAKRNIQVIFVPEIQVLHLPQRYKFSDIVRHSYKLGQYTMLLKDFVRNYKTFSFLEKSPFWFLILSPIIAFLSLLKIVILDRLPVRYWHTLPVVYILKCAWCIGATKGFSKDH